MALAQVVYHISTDNGFASQMRSDPEGALAAKGWVLSKEEIAFLLKVLKNEADELSKIFDVARKNSTGWR